MFVVDTPIKGKIFEIFHISSVVNNSVGALF
jgi:hypothetical protein